MLKYMAPAAVAALTMLGAVNDANAWSRSGSTTGPGGRTASHSGSGSCSGGSCSSSQTATGPRGNSVTRNGQTSCSDGSCSGSATYTGPNGRSATRTRSTSR